MFFDEVVRSVVFEPANKLKGPSTLLGAWVAAQDVGTVSSDAARSCDQADQAPTPPKPPAARSDPRVQAETWSAARPGGSRPDSTKRGAEDSTTGRPAWREEETTKAYSWERGECTRSDASATQVQTDKKWREEETTEKYSWERGEGTRSDA